jgi:hypothetical protein
LDELFVMSDLMSLFDFPNAVNDDSMQLFDLLRLVVVIAVVVVGMLVGAGSIIVARGA